MTRTSGSNDLRPLPFLHAAAMLGLAAAWVLHCWRQNPLRRAPAGRDAQDGFVGLDHAFDVFAASLGDVLLGFCSLLLFAVGTGVYVRRFQIWIDARSSGEAVAYGSADLKDQALVANTAAKANDQRGS